MRRRRVRRPPRPARSSCRRVLRPRSPRPRAPPRRGRPGYRWPRPRPAAGCPATGRPVSALVSAVRSSVSVRVVVGHEGSPPGAPPGADPERTGDRAGARVWRVGLPLGFGGGARPASLWAGTGRRLPRPVPVVRVRCGARSVGASGGAGLVRGLVRSWSSRPDVGAVRHAWQPCRATARRRPARTVRPERAPPGSGSAPRGPDRADRPPPAVVEPALRRTHGPGGQRRAQVGDGSQCGQHVVGSNGGRHLPYDHVQYGTPRLLGQPTRWSRPRGRRCPAGRSWSAWRP